MLLTKNCKESNLLLVKCDERLNDPSYTILPKWHQPQIQLNSNSKEASVCTQLHYLHDGRFKFCFSHDRSQTINLFCACFAKALVRAKVVRDRIGSIPFENDKCRIQHRFCRNLINSASLEVFHYVTLEVFHCGTCFIVFGRVTSCCTDTNVHIMLAQIPIHLFTSLIDSFWSFSYYSTLGGEYIFYVCSCVLPYKLGYS